MTLCDAIRQTKEVLIRDGWCQYKTQDARGRKCLVGALNTAFFEAGEGAEANTSFSDFVTQLSALGSVVEWNDAPGRTLDEVISMLDEMLYEEAPAPELEVVA